MRNNTRSYGYVAVLFLALALALSPQKAFAGSGGNADAKQGQMLGMLLTLAGVVTVGIGVSKLPSPSAYVWIAAGVAEIAGGAMAMSNNSKTEEETRAGPELGFDPAAPGGAPGSLPGLPNGVTLEGLCKQAGSTCTCSGTNCSNPKVTIPSLAEMKSSLADAYNKAPEAFPPGFSLDEALGKLDNEFGAAEDAINKFNAASDNGAFSADKVAGDGKVQGVPDPKDLTSGKDLPVVGKAGADKFGTDADASAVKRDWFGKPIAGLTQRAPVRPVNRHGLTLEDARTGRLLTLFERVSRAIRADRDRDITLAKIEWARKELAKKEKAKGRAIATQATVDSSLK